MKDDHRQTESPFDIDNRLAPRFAFGAVQRIAIIVDDELPDPDSFESVRCVDISRTGCAFYRRTLPESSDLVVALGDPPDLTYLTARVVQSSMVDRWGHLFFRIGCQFTGRLELVEHSLALKRQQDLEAGFLIMAGPGAATTASDRVL